MNECSVIMYHYVRDLKHSRYPSIKGCDEQLFLRQLDFLQENYNPVRAEDIYDAINHNKKLPEKACHLTFDDGYLEHYTFVFPELLRRGLSGSFYPPVCALARNKVLPVNKIHLILAEVGDDNIPDLINACHKEYTLLKEEYPDLPAWEQLWDKLARESRFDSKEIIFFKQLCQYALPENIRQILVDALFDHYVRKDENMLAKELYVSKDMLRVMAVNGMHIGAHGQNHVWLNSILPHQQEEEINSSLEMLDYVYDNMPFWSIAYPFGVYNSSLLEICDNRKCAFAFTTDANMAKIGVDSPLLLPRMDTNDITRIM